MARHERPAHRLATVASVLRVLGAAWLLSLPTLSGAAPEGAARPVPKWIAAADRGDRAVLAWLRDVRFKSVRIYRIAPGAAAPAGTPAAAGAPAPAGASSPAGAPVAAPAAGTAAGTAATKPPGVPAGFVLIGETGDNTYTDATVAAGGFYRYRLTGVGADGKEGPPSPEMSVRIASRSRIPPAVPVWLGYLPTGKGVVLKWGEQEGADVIAYNLYRKAPPTNTFGLVNSVTGTSFTDTALEPGKPAVYAVTALDSSFVETAFSAELPVTRAPKSLDEPGAAKPKWQLRRTRLIAMVTGGDQPFSRPADVVVGPVSGDVYLADSGRNRIFVFNSRGGFQRTIEAVGGGSSAFQRVIGLGVDRDETVYAVDAGRGDIFAFGSQGGERRRLPIAARTGRVRGLADCAVGANGKLFVVDNSNDEILHSGRSGAAGAFGASGFRPGELAAPTFCATDDAGNFYVADTLNARVQVFSGAGEFMRAFGRGRRGAGGMLRPKGVAVAANGEIYVADSWQNSVQVFAATGQHVAVLADENGNALDLGSPNGVALGAGNMIYIAERLSARLQIREIIDEAR